MRVALLFIDGVGIGRADPAVNPLARLPLLLSQFTDRDGEPLPSGGRLQALDTTFGVPGRPQSASNQTAFLTGLPAPRLIGKHVLGFPNAPLRELLAASSIVKQLVAAERNATFANAYPLPYLRALGLPHLAVRDEHPSFEIPHAARRRLRPSASTLAMAAGPVPLRTIEHARDGVGMTHDIDGARAQSRGLAAPRRTPEEAAEVFWRLAVPNGFTLFEHYQADEAGHAQDFEAASSALETFDRFTRAVVALRPHDAHVLVCSDHGNVEDLSTRSHTLNRVPLLHFGPSPLRPLENVADIGTTILELLGVRTVAG